MEGRLAGSAGANAIGNERQKREEFQGYDSIMAGRRRRRTWLRRSRRKTNRAALLLAHATMAAWTRTGKQASSRGAVRVRVRRCWC